MGGVDDVGKGGMEDAVGACYFYPFKSAVGACECFQAFATVGELELELVACFDSLLQFWSSVQDIGIAIVAMEGYAGKALTNKPFVGRMDVAEVVDEVEDGDILRVADHLACFDLLLAEAWQGFGCEGCATTM